MYGEKRHEYSHSRKHALRKQPVQLILCDPFNAYEI